MSTPRILVAGIGNIFLGDDAFGVEVVNRLALRALPEGVCVVDFGIRGLDLTYALLDGYEAVILVDAVPRGGRPGTLYLIEPEVGSPPEAGRAGLLVEGHGMDPVRVLRLAASMGGRVDRLLLIGCEPGRIVDAGDMQDGLSEPVREAVDEAVVLVESLVARLLRGECIEANVDLITPVEEAGPCRD
jgi:hydrogenase maturation protease